MKLRPLEPEDLQLLYTIENDPALWDTTACDVPCSRYALKQYIASAPDFHSGGELRLVVEAGGDGEGERPVGIVDLTSYEPRPARAEVGIALLRAERGKGYGSRALCLLEELARDRLRLHSLYAHVAQSNAPSCALFERCGYTMVATLTDWLYCGGAYEDAVLYQKIFRKK